jgi:FkbM family methyltransferase
MGKLRTACSLVTSGAWSRLGERWRIHIRQKRLARAAGRPFAYRMAGCRQVCLPGVADSVEMFLTGDGDSFEVGLLKSWLERGDSFVDVGANLGFYSSCVHQQLRGECEVVAVEASPQMLEHLRESVRLLGLEGIRFEGCAVGDGERDVVFYEAAPGRATGVQSMQLDPERAADYVKQVVPMKTLTRIMEGAKSPAAVKMDIEGAEVMALSGVPPGWFGADGPLWIVEVNPPVLARFGVVPRDLTDHFSPEAFDLWICPNYAKHGARRLPLRRLNPEEAFEDAWFYNLVAVPKGASFARRRSQLAGALQSGAM